MSESPKFDLPFVDPAQAQKHVPVNESFARLDAMTQLRLQARDVTLPPADGADGDVYAVGQGALNDWTGRDGSLALRANGGWVHVQPQQGWTAWSVTDAAPVQFDGGGWSLPPVARSASGAAIRMEVLEAL